jgi:hypothetical protein
MREGNIDKVSIENFGFGVSKRIDSCAREGLDVRVILRRRDNRGLR